MKKLTLSILLVLVIVFLYGCSDSTTNTQQSSEVKQTRVSVANDSMAIYFNVSGTTYNFSQQDSNLNFSAIPGLKYNVTLSAGSADVYLYTRDSSSVWGKHFSANTSDSLVMSFIPLKYIYVLNGFTGTGTIIASKFNIGK